MPWRQGCNAPTIVPVHGDVNQDVASDEAVRACTVEWTWIARDGARIHDTGRQQITLYLEEYHGQWNVVGHQSRDMVDAQ